MTKLPRIVYLVIGIPLSSVLLGVVLLIAATRGAQSDLPMSQPPLSKTSWQHPTATESSP